MRLLATLACAVLVGLPALAAAAPSEQQACASLLSVDQVCVRAAVVRGESLGCLDRVEHGNNSTGNATHRFCRAAFTWRVHGSSSPLPGTVIAQFDGGKESCLALANCTLANRTIVEVEVPLGASEALVGFHLRARTEQPGDADVGLGDVAVLAVEVEVEAQVRVHA